MTDERNPSDDVLDALAERLHQWVAACPGDGTCGSIGCHPGYYTFIERAAAEDLLMFFDERSEVVVRAPGLNHGDELVRVDGMRVRGTQDNPKFTPTDSWVRRPVPEPATKPEPCVCGPRGSDGPAWDCPIHGDPRPPSCSICMGDYRRRVGTCVCGGSGVATTEGNQQ